MTEHRRTVELGRMSWEEIAELIEEGPVVLLPLGTVEQHGPHMPVNADNMVSWYVAVQAAKETGAVVAPSINYGLSASFRYFPGTFSVQPATFTAVLRDVLHSMIRQGFRRFVFIDNHGGNEGVCDQVAREIRDEYGILIGDVYPWNLGYALMRDTYDDPAKAYGHGAEPETSAMLEMFPEDVLLDRMTAGRVENHGAWTVAGPRQVTVPGQPVGGTLYLDSHEVAPLGVTGSQEESSADRGKIWVERVVGFAVAFIAQYDELTRAEDWARVPNDTGMVRSRRTAS